MARAHLGHEALIVGPGVRTGLPLVVDNPHEVGPDRVANCVAALALRPAAAGRRRLRHGHQLRRRVGRRRVHRRRDRAGLEVAVNALGARAARLFGIELAAPRTAIGKNTAENMQSGAVFGFAGLVDGLVRRFAAELGGDIGVIATGGPGGPGRAPLRDGRRRRAVADAARACG